MSLLLLGVGHGTAAASGGGSLPALPSTNLVASLYADDYSNLFQSNAGTGAVAADGDVIGRWRASNDNSVIFNSPGDNSTRPVLKVIGGKSYVRFDGTDDYLLKSSKTVGDLNALTVAVAIVPQSVAASISLYSEGPSSATQDIFSLLTVSADTNDITSFVRKTDGTTLSTGQLLYDEGIFAGTPVVMIYTYNGTQEQVWINGVAGTAYAYSKSGAVFSNLDQTSIGARVRNTIDRYSQIDYAAIGVWSDAKGSTDRATINTVFGDKLGLTL